MRDDRLARALLTLYPRRWRERYGDEFLALVQDAGLSWRTAADIAAAAAAERERAAAALARYQLDPAEVRPGGVIGARAVLVDAVLVVPIGLTVALLGLLGVPSPTWWFWVWLLNRSCTHHDLVVRTITEPLDRLAVSFWWFAAATGLTGLAWLAALTSRGAGASEPSTATFYTAWGVFIGCAGLRGLHGVYRAYRRAYRAFRFGGTSVWPGLHPRETQAWTAGCLCLAVVTASSDPGGTTFWSMVFISWMALEPPFGLTRAGVAWRRALRDELERRRAADVDVLPPRS